MIGDDSEWIGGAYVHCSYFLTGENRIYERYGQHGAQFGRNVPYSNFFWVPGCCGPGAWELKARWSNLTLNNVDSGQYNDLTLGFNWYWSDRIRIMFDYIHPVTAPGTTPFGATTSDIIGMRFDYNSNFRTYREAKAVLPQRTQRSQRRVGGALRVLRSLHHNRNRKCVITPSLSAYWHSLLHVVSWERLVRTRSVPLRCGGPCKKVCRLVCEEKKVEVVCWGCKCEDFCVPGPGCPTCEHCKCVCQTCDEGEKPSGVYC